MTRAAFERLRRLHLASYLWRGVRRELRMGRGVIAAVRWAWREWEVCCG